ncbi:hypothetical protein PLICRDRAFT_39403 [Plicaturopsis crispa FD-325 SS-3]|nr:hypothetical protein PLICRDRAFT_39403 [Plicaturopsis crispa FD-325 SS-3]
MSMSVPQQHRGDPWFEDGNIILICEGNESAFKVHRGVLSRQSEIFQSLFEIPQPLDDGAESLEGCQIVQMHDSAYELSNLIKGLYDGVKFHTRNLEDFFYLAGILRLATKYFISSLRTQAIRHLTQTWSHTLAGHDAMVDLALQSPLIDDTTYPYVHPLHILNLAREVNVRIVVPSALYFLSLYPLEDLLRADHPKLLVEHPSRPSSELSLLDVRDYTLMFQHRLEVILSFVRRFTSERKCVQGFPTSGCQRTFAKLGSRLSRSWMTRTGPLHYMHQAELELNDDGNVCSLCRRSFQNDVKQLRQEVWDGLPGVVGLPCWGALEDMDLPKDEKS